MSEIWPALVGWLLDFQLLTPGLLAAALTAACW